jgi:hypothetical protein
MGGSASRPAKREVPGPAPQAAPSSTVRTAVAGELLGVHVAKLVQEELVKVRAELRRTGKAA